MIPRPNLLIPDWVREYPREWSVVSLENFPDEYKPHWRFEVDEGRDGRCFRFKADTFFHCPWFRLRDVHKLICAPTVRNLK